MQYDTLLGAFQRLWHVTVRILGSREALIAYGPSLHAHEAEVLATANSHIINTRTLELPLPQRVQVTNPRSLKY